MKKILSSLCILLMLSSSVALAEPGNTLTPIASEAKEDPYIPYRLPKPEWVSMGDTRKAMYTFAGFRELLAMDNDLRFAEGTLPLVRLELKEVHELYDLSRTQLADSDDSLQACMVDHARITLKWKDTEAAKNKEEARKSGGLLTITGWTIAGVSFSVSVGLLIGLIAK